MLKNNNCSSSYAKVRANKSLSIQNSGGSSSNGSNYKDMPSFNQNKSSSISSRNSQDSGNRNKFLQNNQYSTIQEDNFNHLNRNLDFSQINLKSQQKQLSYGHNSSIYSQENKENYNLNYSNQVNNQAQLNQQQETFRKISQNNQQVLNSMNTQQTKSKQSSTIQPKNIYQQIMSNNFNQVAKKNKQSSSNLQSQQQRQSLDLSNKNNDGIQDLQKKRSESTYSNYSLDSSSNNQSILMASSKNQNNISNINSIQLNNWLQNNQIISLDNMKQAPPPDSSNCINISHLLNQNISQSNISINDSSNFISISPGGISQGALKSKQNLSFNDNMYNNSNNYHNQINESQNHHHSHNRQINSVQNSKNNSHQAQQINQKLITNPNNNFIKQNSNQKINQKIQMSADSSHQLQTFSSSENNHQINSNNNYEINYQNNNFCSSQSNPPSTGNTLENLTIIQKSNEVNQLKKDLRQSNNELMQYKNKLKTIEQENKNLKQQFEQDKQQKLHLEEYIQKIKGLQFIVAQEKRISSRIVQENLQRNESVSLILTNLASIIQIIQQKIETPKTSYEKILSQISQNLNPILLCLNPIIQDINAYNQTIIKQLQNQHESRIEPIQQMNKQTSQKGKKVLTIKGTQEQQFQRNGSNNKLNNNQNLKKRGGQLDEPLCVQRQKKLLGNQIQSTNSLSRSHSSINVKQQQQKINQKNQNGFNKLNEDQYEQISNGTQHLLKQSLSSINLQTQSLNIAQLGEQNENEIEAIITKQLLNHNNNPLQQIKLNQQNQDQKNQANKSKNQQISLNECQRINTKESMDSFYQQCLLNNSLRISESSRSISANNGGNQQLTQEQINQNIQQLTNSNQQAKQQRYSSVNSNQKEQFNFIDSYSLQSGNIFGQFTECSSNLQGIKIPSARGSFFDSKSSQIDNYSSNHVHKNSLESQRNDNNSNNIQPYISQEFTGSFSTQQNQNYLVGTFSQIPQDCSSKINVESNYQSGSSDPFNQEVIKNRRNSNPFKMSNYNSNSSNYNQSQKLFSDTLRGLGETLKNLQQDEQQHSSLYQQKNVEQEAQIKSKSTFRSNEEQSEQLYQSQQSQIKDQLSEEISSVNDRLSQLGTEKSSTQLEIENLKKKIMQRQSRRKLQNIHNTSVQEISHNINSQREMSAPPKDSQVTN